MQKCTLARLCWNSNGWQKPSGWSKKSTHENAIEAIQGFGYEEWLFDLAEEKIINGYHYGWIEDKNLNGAKGRALYTIPLDIIFFTIDSETKKRFWVGRINDLEIVQVPESRKIWQIYKDNGWVAEMENQVKSAGADDEMFRKDVVKKAMINVRFKPDNAFIFESMKPILKDGPEGWIYEKDYSRYLLRPLKGIPAIFQELLERSKLASTDIQNESPDATTGGDKSVSGDNKIVDAEQNKLVETAAVSFVTHLYESRGWSVQSVESDRCGFDLRCRKNAEEVNIEVKGTRGKNEIFTITSGEVEQARSNSMFLLCVVTNALSTPQMFEYSGKEFLSRFDLEPTQYRATKKK